MSTDLQNLEKVTVSSEAELRQWLHSHHEQQDSIWLVTYKKVVATKYVSREEILDALIAFGWIDGVRQAVDEFTTMQLISPRRTKSWAKSYKVRAERLISEGQMESAGLASVSAAQSTGAWDAMNDVDQLVVPDDLLVALNSHGKALAHFNAFPPSTKRNILRWIESAKTAETRNKRITRTATDAAVGKRVASHG